MALRLHVGCGTVYLDGYVNYVYRSLKSDRDGRPLERRFGNL